jgi:hypothetical protein
MPPLLIYGAAIAVPVAAYLGAYVAGRMAWHRQERRLDELQRRYTERREVARAREAAAEVQRAQARARERTILGR